MRTISSKHVVVSVFGEPVTVIRAHIGAGGFTRHFHDTYSIGLVRSGSNLFELGRSLKEVGPGEISAVNPGEVHDGGRRGVPWAFDGFFPSASLVALVAEGPSASTGINFLSACVVDQECSARLSTFFALALDSNAIEPDELAQVAINALASLLARHATGGVAKHVKDNSLARAAIALLEHSVAAPITLAKMANDLGASPFAIIRAVNAHVGLTPHAYALQMRVNRAVQMIRSGARIAEAALATGFADQSHMTREVRRRWGVTPQVLSRR